MPLTVHCIVKKGESPPVDLCAAALSSSNPPLTPDAAADIERVRAQRISVLNGAESFEIERVFDAICKLPPIEGPRFSRLLLLLADSNCDLNDLNVAFEELRRVSPGNHLYEREDRNGMVTVEATAVVPGTGPSVQKLRINAHEAFENGMQAVAQAFVRLARISDAKLREEVIRDCRKILELRLHLDLTRPSE